MVPTEVPRHLRGVLARWGLSFDARATARVAASRNHTLICRRSGGRRVLVKASAGPRDGGVDFEAEVLPRLAAPLKPVVGAPRIPRLHAVLPGVLAVDWIPGTTLFAARRRAASPGPAVDARIGAAFAVLHAVSRREVWLPERLVRGDLGERIVWTTPEDYAALGPADLALWRSVQADGAATRSLVALVEQETRATACFVHGDARQANVVLSRGRVAFVDWELSGWGDPARDLGMLLGDELAGYLAPRARSERVPLPVLRRRARALVGGYRDTAAREGLDPGAGFGARVMAWAAEALLRRVYTVAHHRGTYGRASQHFTSSALEVLHAPARWARHFLGRAA